MEWEKAKSILIVVLIFLNVSLFTIILLSSKEKSITYEEIKAITTILNDNGIALKCAIPTESSPSRLINVVGAVWDYNYVKNTFFPDDENVIRTNVAGSIVYKSEDRVVTIYNALSDKRPVMLKYEQKSLSGGHDSADAFKSRLGREFKTFELFRATKSDEKETFLYNEKRNDKAVFCSLLQIEITKDMFTAIIKKYDYVSYVDGLHNLYSADEALLAFMRYALTEYAESITIEGFDLGYNFDEMSSADIYKARLYYRVFVKGYSEPVYIDAVTNAVVGTINYVVTV